MSLVMIDDTDLTNIAHAIRNKLITTDTYTPEEMVVNLLSLTPMGAGLLESGISNYTYTGPNYDLDDDTHYFFYVLNNRIFYEDKDLKILNIPYPNYVRLPESCFNNCSNLTEVDIPGVFEIQQNCFNGCENLTTARFGFSKGMIALSSVCDIYPKAFYNCSNLEKIIVAEKDYDNEIENIWDEAFSNCVKFKGFFRDDGRCFKVGNLRNKSFYNCKELNFLAFDSAVNDGGSQAPFYNCPNLKALCTDGKFFVYDNNVIANNCGGNNGGIDLWLTGPAEDNDYASDRKASSCFQSTTIKNVYVSQEHYDSYMNSVEWSTLTSKIKAHPIFEEDYLQEIAKLYV